MSEATGAALMWYLRNVLFFEKGFDHDEDVLLVSYERLVSSPQQGFKRVFNFLGIPHSQWHSRKVVASSIGKRKPPDIEGKVSEECEELL